MPDFSTSVDAAQGVGPTHKEYYASHSARPRRLKFPIGAKFDGARAHRTAITPALERGLVSIMGPNGLFYANTVGAVGSVSAGGAGAAAQARFNVGRLD